MFHVRLLTSLLCLAMAGPAFSQDDPAPLRDGTLDASAPEQAAEPARRGEQSLEDILRRQRGQEVEGHGEAARLDGGGNPRAETDQLGTLGGASDPELWRRMRYDEADIVSSVEGPGATTLIQDGGMRWLELRQGPLPFWGAVSVAAMVVLLAVFFLIRGRIRVDGQPTGYTLTRFAGVERFAHWLLAGSFILLALTGLISLFGRKVMIPLFGHGSFAAIAGPSKWIHDNVSWAFMVSLVAIFVMWVWANLPDRTDWTWIRKGGGFFGHDHPPAKKFNFGQKIVFWAVIVLGASISVSGLALLFPFQMPLFAATFEKINAVDLPGLLGQAPLVTDLAPHQEMQLAQLWHAIVGFALMVVILGHIYIGTLGMEGAFSAMGSGEVGEEWAEQHHSIWAEKKRSEERRIGSGNINPAE